MGAAVDIEAEIKKYEKERDDIYRGVQDFRVDAIKTERAIQQMQSLTTLINGLKKKLKAKDRISQSSKFIEQKKEFLAK